MALITITVSGRVGVGKTTIATMIHEMLLDKHVPTHLGDDNANRITSAGLVERIDVLVDRLTREGNFVQVKTEPILRAPIDAPPKLYFVQAETEDGDDMSALIRAVDKSQAERLYAAFRGDYPITPTWIGEVPDDNKPGVIDWQRINPTLKA